MDKGVLKTFVIFSNSSKKFAKNLTQEKFCLVALSESGILSFFPLSCNGYCHDAKKFCSVNRNAVYV